MHYIFSPIMTRTAVEAMVHEPEGSLSRGRKVEVRNFVVLHPELVSQCTPADQRVAPTSARILSLLLCWSSTPSAQSG